METTYTKVPTEHHKKIKDLKKKDAKFRDVTVLGIYRIILAAGFKSLGLEKK